MYARLVPQVGLIRGRRGLAVRVPPLFLLLLVVLMLMELWLFIMRLLLVGRSLVCRLLLVAVEWQPFFIVCLLLSAIVELSLWSVRLPIQIEACSRDSRSLLPAVNGVYAAPTLRVWRCPLLWVG